MKYLSRYWKTGALLGLALLTASCARIGNYAEERADHAAYGNIRGSQLRALGVDDGFTIDRVESERLSALLAQDLAAEQPEILSLADTLSIAIANSRAYQSRKESLFIQALSLTEVQKAFNWNYRAAASAGTSYTTFDDGSAETFGDAGVDGNLALRMSRTLATGAKVSLGFSQNIARYFASPDTSDSNSALSLNIVQPLLNGFGPLVTLEPLRQAERDMVYAVRDFKRYQQEFVIDITSLYYSTVQGRDQLDNALKNYQSTVANREQSDSYVKAGRIADFEAAQARQSELNAADRWAIARSDYQSTLDRFRFTLGLPIDLNVEPDPGELESLAARGLVGLDITLPEAVESAVSNRLDLITRREQVEDRERRLEIQLRNFLPNLDVDYNIRKELDGSSGVDIGQNLNVGLELPLDWTEKRNAFRIAQINLDREFRNLDEQEWNVQLDVRDLWRRLERNRSVYKNRLLSVTLAERRVENTTLLLKQGKALTRDLLDAQDDLLSSRNEATLALVDYTINRLRFWNAIERFAIDPKGMWYEQVDRTDEEPLEAP